MARSARYFLNSVMVSMNKLQSRAYNRKILSHCPIWMPASESWAGMTSCGGPRRLSKYRLITNKTIIIKRTTDERIIHLILDSALLGSGISVAEDRASLPEKYKTKYVFYFILCIIFMDKNLFFWLQFIFGSRFLANLTLAKSAIFPRPSVHLKGLNKIRKCVLKCNLCLWGNMDE